MKRLPLRMRYSLLTLVFLAALLVGVAHYVSEASVPWYKGTITQTYGMHQEHGVDIWTNGKTITALLSGTVTFDHVESWSGETIQDITWKLDPSSKARARNFSFAYVQIRAWSTYVHVGEHVSVGTPLGSSGNFVEFGLTKSDAYGVHGNWYTDWTTDPRFLL